MRRRLREFTVASLWGVVNSLGTDSDESCVLGKIRTNPFSNRKLLGPVARPPSAEIIFLSNLF